MSARLVTEDLTLTLAIARRALREGWSLDRRRSVFEEQSLTGKEWREEHRRVLASHLSIEDWTVVTFAVRRATTLLTAFGDWDDLSTEARADIDEFLEKIDASRERLWPLASGKHFSKLTRFLHRRQFSRPAVQSGAANRQPGDSADTR